MKNLSLILNLVLGAAVAHLYYLNFSQSAKKVTTIDNISINKDSAEAKPVLSAMRVFYVNSDSLLEQFKSYKSQTAAFDGRQRAMEAQLNGKLQNLEKEMYALQQKAQEGNMTKVQYEQEATALAKKQESLAQEHDNALKQLAAQEKSITDDLQRQITEKLAILKDKYQFDFVLGYSKGGGVLFADKKNDITKDLLEVLNNSTSPKKDK